MPKLSAKSRQMSPFQFFMAYAGTSYHPGVETELQGKRNGAQRLADAEALATEQGCSFNWSVDPYSSPRDWKGKKAKHYDLWACLMRDGAGAVVASLSAIDFGPGETPWGDTYQRVVEAELAIEWSAAL